jgi:drug/metabolite transporter (DMT)-like permease
MTWLLLSVLTNTILLLILKAFDRFGVNTLHGIVVNYFVAGFLGIVLFGIPFELNTLPDQNWVWVPPILGLLFICIFLLIARTAQTIGISVATVANKMSVIIPVLIAVAFYAESITVLKSIGLLLGLVAVYLSSASSNKDNTSQSKNNLWLPALVFIGSGIIDALINHAKNKLVSPAHNSFFVALSFLSAGVLGLVLAGNSIFRNKNKFTLRDLIGGIILGIPNYFSIYCIANAIDSKVMESSALYPLNNMGIVVLSAMGALLFFREKLNWKNILGIGIAVLSIGLIAFS